jgi:hypothetical protein
VSEAQKLRDKAAHTRQMAWSLTDQHARGALEALAGELDQQANDLDAQARDQDKVNTPSRDDTP